jgi:hypothetical protein
MTDSHILEGGVDCVTSGSQRIEVVHGPLKP